MDDLLSTAEAADQLGVTPETLRRWARDSKIAHIRTPGRHRKFRQADVAAFLRSMEQPAGDAA